MEEAIKATAGATVERVVTDSLLAMHEIRYYYSNSVCVVFTKFFGRSNPIDITVLYPKPSDNETGK